MNLLTEVCGKVPYQLSGKNWDVIRIGLGHWILSLTKSLDYALENVDQKVRLKNGNRILQDVCDVQRCTY